MRKLLLIILFLFSFSSYSQYKFKVEYELNNSGTCMAFTAINTHIITGLPPDTKTIKVQNPNGCAE